jgi:hypothetical protein
MAMKALNNILLGLPIRLGAFVCITFEMFILCISRVSAQRNLPSSASHGTRYIAGLHTML